MTSLGLLTQYRALQRRLLNLVSALNDADYRRQFHPDLSPAGWHLGHCLWVENYWLRAIIMGDDRKTRNEAHYYQPQYSPKADRGAKLPPLDSQLALVSAGFEDNILLLAGLSDRLDPEHPLMTDNYLPLFLIQHHSQHLETLRMLLTQRSLLYHSTAYKPHTRLQSMPLSRDVITLDNGEYPIGGQLPSAFDNELAAGPVHVDSTNIGRRPINNAEYLRFIEEGGYTDPRLWDNNGWSWLQRHQVEAPDHWRSDLRGWWYGVDLDGPHDLNPRAAVYGLSLYEARAFAHWSDAGLPHELAWETAARQRLISLTGQVWEWCDNPFFPYDGFEPFPYLEYSVPWFDGEHFALRGTSRFTPSHIRRPSFRNFHTADKRHIFAGLRLSFK